MRKKQQRAALHNSANIRTSVQFAIEEYMGEEDQRLRSSCPDFRSYVEVLRSLNSHRPSSGFKGVHQRGPDGYSEARNSPFPVRPSLKLGAISWYNDPPVCVQCVSFQ
jgi:hypothetical protein